LAKPIKMKIFLILILLIPLVFADEILTSESAILEYEVSTSVEIVPESENFFIDSLTLDLYWLPKESFRQEILELNTNPEAFISDSAKFIFNNPGLNNEIFLISKVKTHNSRKRITSRIDYPLNLEAEFFPYVEEQEIIDFSPEILITATSLKRESSDLYELVVETAKWVRNNVEYDLSTLNVEASIPSSNVLISKNGVCDEITSLFISLLRANGIPSRFISGFSYTNLDDFDNNWQPHGWAEVYFPGFGWVPFDVTYGEYGFLDSGHIKLSETLDAKGLSVLYESRGFSYTTNTENPNFDIEILSLGNSSDLSIDFSISVAEPMVGFGSENLLELHFSNNNNYYIAGSVNLGRTEQLNFSNYDIDFLLKPFEEKTMNIIIETPNNLDSSFQYTFPILAVLDGIYFNTSFKSKVNEQIFEFSEEEAELKGFFSCIYSNSVMFNVDTLINCQSDFTGTFCLNNLCNKEGIFNISFENPGISSFIIYFNNSIISDSIPISIAVLDFPNISIFNISYPETINFSEVFDIEITVNKNSVSKAESAFLTIENIFSKQEFDLNPEGHNLLINVDPSNLGFTNTFKIELFQDDELVDSKTITIKTKTKFFEKIRLLLNVLGIKIYNMFS